MQFTITPLTPSGSEEYAGSTMVMRPEGEAAASARVAGMSISAFPVSRKASRSTSAQSIPSVFVDGAWSAIKHSSSSS